MKKISILFLLVLLVPAMAWGAFNFTTVSEIQKDMRDEIGTDADPYHPNDTLINLINMACREVASYGTIQRLDTIIVKSDTLWIPLNDDCLDVYCVLPCTTAGQPKYDKVYPLGRIDFRDWNRVAAATEETNSKYYAVLPPQILPDNPLAAGALAPRLWLCPQWGLGDDSLWVFYYAEANDLSSSNDTTNIPYVYKNLIVYYALGLAFARSHNYNESAWWFAQYDRARQEKGLLKQLDFIVKPKVIE